MFAAEAMGVSPAAHTAGMAPVTFFSIAPDDYARAIFFCRAMRAAMLLRRQDVDYFADARYKRCAVPAISRRTPCLRSLPRRCLPFYARHALCARHAPKDADRHVKTAHAAARQPKMMTPRRGGQRAAMLPRGIMQRKSSCRRARLRAPARIRAITIGHAL